MVDTAAIGASRIGQTDAETIRETLSARMGDECISWSLAKPPSRTPVFSFDGKPFIAFCDPGSAGLLWTSQPCNTTSPTDTFIRCLSASAVSSLAVDSSCATARRERQRIFGRRREDHGVGRAADGRAVLGQRGASCSGP